MVRPRSSDLVEGKVKEAMISAPLELEISSLKAKGMAVNEAGLKAHRVGNAFTAFAVHPSNPVENLTAAQVADVLSGKIKNWNEVGGADKPIVAICEGKGGGVRSMVEREYLAGGEIAATSARFECPASREDRRAGRRRAWHHRKGLVNARRHGTRWRQAGGATSDPGHSRRARPGGGKLIAAAKAAGGV